MKNIIVLSLSILFLSVSCSTYKSTMDSSSKVRKLELDMKKTEVLKIMGKNYVSISKSKVEDDVLEMIGYDTPASIERYVLQFKNDRLENWNLEVIDPGYRYRDDHRYRSSDDEKK